MWIALALLAVVVLAAGVLLAEQNGRVYGQRRLAADPQIALALASEMGARFEAAAITAHDGLALAGWYFEPAAGGNGSAMLVLHGFTDRNGGMLDHIRPFLRNGYAVLAPDSRAHGASAGNDVSFGVCEAPDVPLWGDWLCRRAGVDDFAVFGQSMGAAVALLALDREPRIRAVVAESPFTTFAEAAYDRLADRAHVPAWVARTLFRPSAEIAFLYCRLRHGFNLHHARPIDSIRRARVPVLLIHGLLDQSIHHEQSRRLHAAQPAAVLWEVAGADHTKPIEVAPDYEARVIGFLEQGAVHVTSRRAGNRA